MIKPTLISITNELVDLQKVLEDNSGELPLELEMSMSQLLAESKSKVTNYTIVLNSYENEISFVKERIREAQEYIQRLQRMQQKLLDIAGKAIDLKGESLEGEMGKLIYSRKSTSVDVNCDPSELPDDFVRLKAEPDKIAIKEALTNGVEIKGCKLIEKKSILWK